MWVKSVLSNEHSEHVYKKDSDCILANQSLAQGGLGCGFKLLNRRSD